MQIHYHNCSGCTDSWCKTPNSDGSITECVPDVTLIEGPTEVEMWQSLAFNLLELIDSYQVKDNRSNHVLKPTYYAPAAGVRNMIQALHERYEELFARIPVKVKPPQIITEINGEGEIE